LVKPIKYYGTGVGSGGIWSGAKRGNIASRIASAYTAAANITADDFTSFSMILSYVSRLVCHCNAEVLDRILRGTDARQAGLVERSAVCSAKISTFRA
jgi:hypothetical protein